MGSNVKGGKGCVNLFLESTVCDCLWKPVEFTHASISRNAILKHLICKNLYYLGIGCVYLAEQYLHSDVVAF